MRIGFIARADGSVDWLNSPRLKGTHGMGAFYRSIDTFILERKTYEQAVKFGMTSGYSGKKNFVLSRTLTKAASPKVSIIDDEVSAFAERLRGKQGKHIWLVGGADLIASFLDAAAVDEFIIHVIPHIIGDGIPLVSPRHRDLPLKLLTSRAFADGVVRLALRCRTMLTVEESPTHASTRFGRMPPTGNNPDVISELSMGLRPTHMHENRFEPERYP